MSGCSGSEHTRRSIPRESGLKSASRTQPACPGRCALRPAYPYSQASGDSPGPKRDGGRIAKVPPKALVSRGIGSATRRLAPALFVGEFDGLAITRSSWTRSDSRDQSGSTSPGLPSCLLRGDHALVAPRNNGSASTYFFSPARLAPNKLSARKALHQSPASSCDQYRWPRAQRFALGEFPLRLIGQSQAGRGTDYCRGLWLLVLERTAAPRFPAGRNCLAAGTSRQDWKGSWKARGLPERITRRCVSSTCFKSVSASAYLPSAA